MSDKPGDFFLGVIDFFGILVPGVVLLVLQGPTLGAFAGVSVPEAGNWRGWLIAMVAAYVAGHFLLGLGAPLNRLANVVFPEARDPYYQAVAQQVPLPPTAARNRSNVFNAASLLYASRAQARSLKSNGRQGSTSSSGA